MKTTNLIQILQDLVEKYGDQEIIINDYDYPKEIEEVIPQNHNSYFYIIGRNPDGIE